MEIKAAKAYNVKSVGAHDDRTNLKTAVAAGKTGVKNTSRIRTGYCSVFGNLDSYNDVTLPGAFKSAIAEFRAGNSRVQFLWQHRSDLPPIGKILDVSELGETQLPLPLKLAGATGCLKVTREYYKTQLADEVLAAIDGAGLEMSFGFNLQPDDFEYSDLNGVRARLIKNLTLMDVSDVAWGANDLTVAAVDVSSLGKNYSSDYLRRKRLQIQKIELDALECGLPIRSNYCDSKLQRQRREIQKLELESLTL